MSASLAKQYQRKTDKQHILDNPDTYIGSIEQVDAPMWVFDEETKKIMLKTIDYIPGLYKLFDEGIVNCRDHVVRMHQCDDPDKKLVSYIESAISEDGTITFTNDGNGIDIVKHPEYDIWIPEMIFGHLRTSTNYNKDEEKIVGGKNGFGFKLVLIWSSYGYVETIDHKRGLKYVQEFHDNLNRIDPPTITKLKIGTKPYTKVAFRPDYTRYGIPGGLTPAMVALLKKRVYDIAAVSDHSTKKINVIYNGDKLQVKNFQQYVDLYIGEKSDAKRVYEMSNDRWEYAVALSQTHEFQQVSFVNGICTFKGGKHVDYIMGQITRKLVDFIEKKKKMKVNATSIKEQLILFLRCDVVNPAFDSQTKDYMNTPSAKFGSTCVVSDGFIEKLAKMGVMDLACSLTEAKENRVAAKKTDGTKTKTIRGIENFIDANDSGGANSANCILILCEGLSAMSGIVSGLSQTDRNTIGIYPLKGKVLNVRGETATKISENKEITDIKKILGLENGREYKTMEDVCQYLRYGKVMIMTDQDHDGSHIKGLCINLVHSQWSSLVKIPGFISFMNTPILRAKKGQQTRLFYNEGEYNQWKQELTDSGENLGSWTVKYFKGLGTSTSAEFKEYFSHKKIVNFTYMDETSDNMIDKIFNKKRADDRKVWLENYDKHAFLDTSRENVSYDEFIDNELIHFSTYDCARSIPNMVDGLKTSLRKILFCAFKRKLTTEIKVAQFAGYVSEHSAYHHGEASLNGAIVNMAQTYTGSNNINLLMPNGQFGCIDPETPVLLWNGNIEFAKNIKVGDKLVGDDGECRIVSKTINGVDEMYEISNGNMDNYIVNSYHILTICYSQHKLIYWKSHSNCWTMNYFNDITKTVKYKTIKTINSTSGNHKNKSNLTKEDAYNKMLEFSNTINDNNIFDINVQQYLSLSNSVKKSIKGVVNSAVVQWKEQPLPIDPYILGLWLGDGMSDCHAFASNDDEIVKTWAIWLDKIGCEICHVKNIPPHENHSFYIRRRGSSTNKTPSIGDINHSSKTCIGCTTSKHIRSSCDWTFEKQNETIVCNGKNINGHNVVNLNPFKELFKLHKLYKNKHVPLNYIVNSQENRLKLLAGMIDTDGCLKRQGGVYSYHIDQCEKRKHILESFRIIAGSLGFRAKIYKNKNNMYTLSITGNTIYTIPVQLKRKQCVPENRVINNYTHSMEIKSIGTGQFCGWNIDKNERFLLGDFTITHNTRLHSGADSASERYIFTQLNPITRAIFPDLDDAILNYLDDDGTLVEPEFYVPIIPFALVNGISGIGTGFSCEILPYNPQDIIQYLKAKLGSTHEHAPAEFIPYYEGFKGTVEKIAENKYLVKGCYEKIGEDKIRITELPIGTATMPYIKKFLEGMVDCGVDKAGKKIAAQIKDFTDNSTEVRVDICVQLLKGDLEKLEKVVDVSGINGIEKLLKLTTTLSSTNMHMFNRDCKLHKYLSVEEIIDEFYSVRIELYVKRKAYLLEEIEKRLVKLSNRAKYIMDNLNDKIDLRRKTNVQVCEMLKGMGFDTLDGEYKYLTGMPMHSVTKENVDSILKEKADCETELDILTKTSESQMWIRELENLEKEYLKYKIYRTGLVNADGVAKKPVAKSAGIVRRVRRVEKA